MQDAARERFVKKAERVAALQDARAAELEAKVVRFAELRGDERALDAACGAGALAFALAPHVREVVGVDIVPELLEQGRQRAGDTENVEFVEGDATKLPFARGSFDLAGTLRSLHHIERPELVLAELTRVTRLGGRILVVDQLAPIDPLAAFELNAFERARDPSHTRTLADVDLRHLFESNGLVLVREDYEREERELDPYLDLAGCEGEERERAQTLAPSPYVAELGWYLLDRR
ncbi:MAG TPA: methyltransferase domain-containing protein [Gaiellaceae bacterium]|nr:methyltransferase domain-containing protein [Gaiellaceae bacterium]